MCVRKYDSCLRTGFVPRGENGLQPLNLAWQDVGDPNSRVFGREKKKKRREKEKWKSSLGADVCLLLTIVKSFAVARGGRGYIYSLYTLTHARGQIR